MEEIEKGLLIQDLCGRLPYGIICKYWAKDYAKDCGDFISEDEGKIESISFANREVVIGFTCVDLDTDIIKPYLRPMSSMTEKENNELGRISCEGNIEHKYGIFYRSQDYLNSIHIDYRGLIEKGLALPAPEGMYK